MLACLGTPDLITVLFFLGVLADCLLWKCNIFLIANKRTTYYYYASAVKAETEASSLIGLIKHHSKLQWKLLNRASVYRANCLYEQFQLKKKTILYFSPCKFFAY